MRKQRDLYQVMRVLEKRYGLVGDTLLETFLDHECIHTLETLISYGPKETGGEDSDTWQEYMSAAGDTDLEAARFGAYKVFKDLCKEHGLNPKTTFTAFSDAYAYWGTNLEGYEEIQRAGAVAESYVADGKRYLRTLKRRTIKECV